MFSVKKSSKVTFALFGFALAAISAQGHAEADNKMAALTFELNPAALESRLPELDREQVREMFLNQSDELLEPLLIVDWSKQEVLALPEAEFSLPGA